MPETDHNAVVVPPPPIPDYELIERIGQGAYGDVWLARNVLGEQRAVKVIHRSRFNDPRPFEREFEGIQRFEPVSRSHPSQLAILHVGKNDAAGCFYYVMELADAAETAGEKVGKWESEKDIAEVPLPLANPETYTPKTLRSLLLPPAHSPTCPPARPVRLPIPDCIQIGLSLTTALAHLHRHGLVHRDIKPSNLIFVNGVPKLGDIGLVTEAGDTQSIVGTEGYLPPEGPGTPQADIFSLGKVLYEISTGMDRRKFPALPDELPQLPERRALLEFNEVLLRACAHDARERYGSAEAMRSDLKHLAEGRSVKRRRMFGRSRRLALMVTSIVGAVCVVALILSRFSPGTPPFPNPTAITPASVFVMPFRNDGTNQVDELLRSRITDAIIDGLALVKDVTVGPRTSGWANRNEDLVRREFAKEFSHVMSGRVGTNAAGLVATIALSNTVLNRLVWRGEIAAAHAGQVALERTAIEHVAAALARDISPEARQVIDQVLTDNLQALELFRQAPDGLTRSIFDRKVQLLSQASRLDPKFAQARSTLARAYVIASDLYLRPQSAMSMAHREAQAAVALDDTLSEAHQMLGSVAFYFEWDWDQAEREFKRAIELAPNATWPRWRYAKFLRALGRLEEARRESEAAARIAPDAAPSIMAEQLYAERRFPEALASCLRHLESGTDNGQWAYLGELYYAAGRPRESLAALEKTVKLFDGTEYLCRLGFVHARLGNRARAEAILADVLRLNSVTGIGPYHVAVLLAGLGQRDECLSWLSKSIEERSTSLVAGDLGSLMTDSCWDDVRSDPRFTELVDRVGLPSAAKQLALRRIQQ